MSKKPLAKTKSKSNDDFIDDAVVSGGTSSYLKFLDGDTKFRIISKPIFGWVQWEDKKPTRSHIDDEPQPIDEEKPKKFMALAVIDREDTEVKILEVTQQSVIKAIKAFAANPDWGKPFTYDITVNRTGEALKTKYTVQPSPKKPLDKAAIKAANEKPCNLDNLFKGEDPWTDEGETTEYFFK